MPNDPTPAPAGTYRDYMEAQFDRCAADPSEKAGAAARTVAAFCLWMHVPDDRAAAERADESAIERWAERIGGTKVFARLMEDPSSDRRMAQRDAQGLTEDLRELVKARTRAAPERAAEKTKASLLEGGGPAERGRREKERTR